MRVHTVMQPVFCAETQSLIYFLFIVYLAFWIALNSHKAILIDIINLYTQPHDNFTLKKP